MHSERAGSPARIFAVIVLYKVAAADSATLRTLLASAEQTEPADLKLHVLLYDNTPGAEIGSPDRRGFITCHAERANRGLAGAYNEALRRAEAGGYEWLLTLDQDTELPLSYLPFMAGLLRKCQDDPSIAAIVPRLVDKGRQVSPMQVLLFTHKPLPSGWNGVPEVRTQALNSAALLRVSALREIGGFHPLFWLNYLDNWLHRELYEHGKRTFVARDVVIEHELSLLDYRGRMTLAHYTDFLLAESAFRDLYGSAAVRLAYTLQLGLRWLNQRRRGEKQEILAATRDQLIRHVVRRRARRLQEWRAEMTARLGESHG